MKKRIYLASPHMGGEELKFINEAFESNWVAPLGPNVTGFENEICEYTEAKSAAATVSGTSAIHLALKCLGVGKGDIVFCSTLTFSATANPIIYQGAEPVFIDSDYKTWNMCPIALQKAFDDAKKNNKIANEKSIKNTKKATSNASKNFKNNVKKAVKKIFKKK